jgi:hypothetical protein
MSWRNDNIVGTLIVYWHNSPCIDRMLCSCYNIKFMIMTQRILPRHCSYSYMFYSIVENTCMTSIISTKEEASINKTSFILSPRQVRGMTGMWGCICVSGVWQGCEGVYVCQGYDRDVRVYMCVRGMTGMWGCICVSGLSTLYLFLRFFLICLTCLMAKSISNIWLP